MITLTKTFLALMIGFILATTFGVILIPLLRKLKAKQSLSIYLEERHHSKSGTPTMGGLIFIIPTIITMCILKIMGKINISYNFLIVIFTFIGYFLIGFIDDLLIIKRHNNAGLSESAKLILQTIIAVIFFFLFMKAGNEPLLWIHTLNIKIDIKWWYGLFILLVLIASSNAVNITDGLDGLAGGLSTIAFLAFGIISFGSYWIKGSEDIGVFCFILVGSLLGFLVYNTHPAKVFMGDTGSLSLGATMATIAIITSHELTLIVIAGVFIIETLSCIIQMVAGRYFNKKVFLMAPLHHHFEKLGWAETDIVKLFLVIGTVLGLAAVTFGVWL